MRSAAEVDLVLGLRRRDGLGPRRIAKLTGIPVSTVRDWLAGRVPTGCRDPGTCVLCNGADPAALLPTSYAYLLGMYLGDGCLSQHPRSVFRLRIVLDAKYPAIIESCAQAMRDLHPRGKASRVRKPGCVEVVAYWKHWPCLFPQHGPGRKHARPIWLSPWQDRIVRRHPDLLLRGLIHSDGCRFQNTGTKWSNPRYSFTNRSADIRRIFCDACDRLGLRWTTAPHTVYVSRKADVARMDQFIGPKA
jgi:hypothetical protein